MKPEMEVLDFGCGTGTFAVALAHLVHVVTGVDTSPAMIMSFKMKLFDR